MIYPDNFEVKIEFYKIRELIQENCLCPLGRQKVDEMQFSNDFNKIKKSLSETNEFKTLLLTEDGFPTRYFPEDATYLSKARIEGAYLIQEELFSLLKTLQLTQTILHFFQTKTEEKYPCLNNICASINFHKEFPEIIEVVLDKNAHIKDTASKELMQIRRSLAEKQHSVSRRLHAIMKFMQGEGWLSADLSMTLVNGRTVIPVDSTYKRKIKGFVHAESATGKTSYIEPTEVVELNNEIKELEYEEQKEIIKILVDITNQIRPYLEDVRQYFEFIAAIDFIRAKALYAKNIEAVFPSFVDEPIVQMYNARHPLLYSSFKKNGKSVVPLQIAVNNKQRIILISGPNAGGKSVCLKTVGLLQYMIQCGLLVPVAENSEFGVFDHVFIDIGDEQSIENDLSTYSSHLRNMKFFLKNCNAKTLLLIDEFGSGTEPVMGGAIAEAVLEALNAKQTSGVITTHYSGLKHFAMSAEGIVNGAMLYDHAKLEPLFILETGNPGSSFAFEIARKIGIPEEIVQLAISKVGKDQVYFDKHLRDVLRDKKYIEEKRIKIKQSEKKLGELMNQLVSELSSIDKERKEILKQAKSDAAELLSTVNKKIENAIIEIRKVQAEKEQTKIVRNTIDELKKNISISKVPDDDKILKKIEFINNRKNRLQQKKQEKEIIKTENPVNIAQELKIGDYIKIKDKAVVGEVIEIGETNLVVALGNLFTTIKKESVECMDQTDEIIRQKKKAKQASNIISHMHQKVNEFSTSIDVRGMRGDETLLRIAEYIDEAVMLNMSEVRILHGKGYGILRRLIRNYLKTVDAVRSFTDEQMQLGGDGITVVIFH